MAYINAQETAQIRNALKAAFPSMKFSVRKEHSMALHVAVLKGNINLQDGQVNEYHLDNTSHPDFWKQVLHIIKTGSLFILAHPQIGLNLRVLLVCVSI